MISALGPVFCELTLVTIEAVNYRNHYVYGSEARFAYDDNFSAVCFFVNTLELVFLASDLFEAGWDVKAWAASRLELLTRSELIGVEYARQMASLKVLSC